MYSNQNVSISLQNMMGLNFFMLGNLILSDLAPTPIWWFDSNLEGNAYRNFYKWYNYFTYQMELIFLLILDAVSLKKKLIMITTGHWDKHSDRFAS